MTRTQRIVLAVSILASFVAFLDSSVVTVALPAISRDLGGGLPTQQWVVDAYLVTLGALMLLAGSLADLFGRKRIMLYGLIGFGVTSLLCAAAPSAPFLIGARALQGVAGALLVPSSLALIISSFPGKSAGRAIGSWTAWTGIAYVVGPLLGGLLVDSASWRYIFAINAAPVVVCVALLGMIPTPEKTQKSQLDILGAFLCSVGLGGTVFALIEQPRYGWHSPAIFVPLLVGLVMLVAFIWHERQTKTPMLTFDLFRIRNFSAGNIATFSIYGGLAIATFLIAIYLQQIVGYSALAAGLALMPVTVIMFFLSPRAGALAGKFGPRLFMTLGPLIAGLGFIVIALLPDHPSYATHILPGVLIFGLGLATTVAPLTAAILRDIPTSESGIASAINNAVARIAGLITIALSGVVIGPQLTLGGFRRAMLATAGVVAFGGIISWIGIRNNTTIQLSDAPDDRRSGGRA